MNTMKNAITLVAVLLLLSACAGFKGSKMKGITPGMSRADVTRRLGDPASVGATGNVEVLHYVEDKGWWTFEYYYVRLVDGEVESSGPETKDRPVTADNPPLKR